MCLKAEIADLMLDQINIQRIFTHAIEEQIEPEDALDKIIEEWSQLRSKDTEMSDNLLDTQTVILERLNAIEKNVDAVRNDTDTIEDMLRAKG